MQLTPYQLGRIEQHLRFDNWLSNDGLLAELTDHYAEVIRAKMESGIPFDYALQLTTADFGGQRGLLAMERAVNAPVFRQSTACFWQVIQSYQRPCRLLLIAGLFLAMGCTAQMWSFTWLFHFAQAYLLMGLVAISTALFVRQSLLYVAGRTTTQPFAAVGFRLTLLFLVFSFIRVIMLVLTLFTIPLHTPLIQATLATLFGFLWLAAGEALFIKNHYAAR